MQREVDWLALRLKLHGAHQLDPSSSPAPGYHLPRALPSSSSPPLRRPTAAELKHSPSRLHTPPSSSLEARLLADLQHLQRLGLTLTLTLTPTLTLTLTLTPTPTLTQP